MNVELEKMEERVIYEVDRAVYILLNPKQQFKGSPGLVARGKWYVGQLS